MRSFLLHLFKLGFNFVSPLDLKNHSSDYWMSIYHRNWDFTSDRLMYSITWFVSTGKETGCELRRAHKWRFYRPITKQPKNFKQEFIWKHSNLPQQKWKFESQKITSIYIWEVVASTSKSRCFCREQFMQLLGTYCTCRKPQSRFCFNCLREGGSYT